MNQWSQYLAVAASRCVVLLASSSLVLVVGCGDASTFKTDPGDIDPASIPEDHACLVGATVALSRYSSSCERRTTSVSSEVEPGVVFTSEQFRTLAPPCDEGPTPGLQIVFDEPSSTIFLDFSTVTSEDRFPDSRFEGYMFDMTLSEENGTLVFAAIDRDRTNVAVAEDDLAWAVDYLAVNLEGVSYDADSQLAIELTFARVPPVLE